MRKFLRSVKGFTLLELIVVIVILGILASIAIPTFAQVTAKSQDASALTTLRAIARDSQALRGLSQTAAWTTSPQDAITETSNTSPTRTSTNATLTASLDNGVDNPAIGEVTYKTASDKVVFSMLSNSKRVCVVSADFTTILSAKCTNTGTDFAGSTSSSSAATLAFGEVSSGGTSLPAGSGGTVIKTYADTVLADGPALYYSLEETSGTSALARAGSNGVYAGPWSATTGAVGSAVSFSSTSLMPNVDPLVGVTGAFSIEMWVKSSGPADYRYLVGTNDWQGTKGVTLYTGISKGLQFVVPTSGGKALTPAIAPAQVWNNQWHHVVATYSSGVARLYMDGTERVSATVPANSAVLANSANPMAFGRFSGSEDPLYYAGAIDEPAIYTKALTPAQISAHYAAR